MQYRLGGAEHELVRAVAVLSLNRHLTRNAQGRANTLEGVVQRLALFNANTGHAHALIPHGVGAQGSILGVGALDDGGVLLLAEHLNEFLGVDMLGGQAGTHHVIGGVHQLNGGTRNVGVHLAVGGKGGLAGSKVHQVHHEGHEQTAVTGVLAVHDAHELGGVGYHIVRGAQQPGGGVYQVLHCGGGGLLGQADNLGQKLLGAELGTLGQPGGTECGGQGLELLDGAHAGEHAHRAQRDDGLGLGVAVLVVAVGRINRDTAGLLVLEAGDGLFGGRVHLNGQGGVNRKDFKEEGEPVGGSVRAQEAGGILHDQLVQRGFGTVHGSARGRSRMRTHPHLSFGLFGGYGHATHTS